MSHEARTALLELRHAATDRAVIVDVDERRLVAIDGIGEPSGSDFRLAADTLRQVARVVARSLRRDRSVTPRPGILECAWWTHPEPPPDELPMAFEDRSTWHWQQMIEIPDEADDATVESAIDEVRRGGGRSLPLVRAIRLVEGSAAQVLHVGGSTDLASSLRKLIAAVTAAGLHPHGHIHELRIADAADDLGRRRSPAVDLGMREAHDGERRVVDEPPAAQGQPLPEHLAQRCLLLDESRDPFAPELGEGHEQLQANEATRPLDGRHVRV